MASEALAQEVETFDVIVVGGGRASNLATLAAQAGLRTAVIERDRLGGTCPNRGCIPSKLLIGFSEAARHIWHADRHFIDAELRSVDMPRALASVNVLTESVDEQYRGRLEASGVEIIRGEARFVGKRELAVGDRRLGAERIILGTGSRPIVPAFADLPVWTSDDVFDQLIDLPKSLMIIGGGVIGAELGAFFAAVGTHTELFVRGQGLLFREDAEIVAVFKDEFTKEVTTHFDANLDDLRWDGQQFTATFVIDGASAVFTAEHVMFATGRRPNTDDLDLAKTGLRADGRGVLAVNEYLETSVPGIFAVGDVNGRLMLQHAATNQAKYLGRRFFDGLTDPVDESLVAHAVFSHPEVASVGSTEAELEERNIPHVAVVRDWSASARARALRIVYPRTKLLVSPEDYSILGCHFVGPESSTLIHQVLMLMQLKNDVRELARMVYVHPAMNECILAVATAAVREIEEFRSVATE